MGCGSSSSSFQPSILENTGTKLVQQKTGLSDKDVSKLYKAFVKIDLTESNLVEFDEFCVRVKCEPTVFLQSLFSFFGSVEDKLSNTNIKLKKLNFPEFLLFLSFFLTLDEDGLAEFLYKVLTDDDYNSLLTEKEKAAGVKSFAKQIKILFGVEGGNSSWQHVEKILKTMDTNKNGKISKSEFELACHQNKSLIFPIFSYQLDLKTKIVGKTFWKAKRGLGNRLMGRIGKTRTELHDVLYANRSQDDVGGIDLNLS